MTSSFLSRPITGLVSAVRRSDRSRRSGAATACLRLVGRPGGRSLRSRAAAAHPDDGGHDGGAGEQRDTTEEERRRVTSCDVDQPTCTTTTTT
ncbi:hypothetical protein EYF80_066839 [Liparis tanakae]|uniref:Uncharacterized protein n=1 Tax=Liparis tanakae TaxID=230148 RepID=A0A4Z2E3U4_9TELE|nr:hypothetical protein EYF80_066839 [Liparis tanakae]